MDNIFDEIFTIIEDSNINSKEEFDKLIFYLTNHPTPLREACAYKLEDYRIDEFIDDKSTDTILYAICDINPNISRSVCKIIEKNPKLQSNIIYKIITKINEIINAIPVQEMLNTNKSHAKNKVFFSLYWLLEALCYCENSKYIDEILSILPVIMKFSDYTIREKAAKLLTKIPNPPIELIDMVRKDSNFYVNFYSKFI